MSSRKALMFLQSPTTFGVDTRQLVVNSINYNLLIGTCSATRIDMELYWSAYLAPCFIISNGGISTRIGQPDVVVGDVELQHAQGHCQKCRPYNIFSDTDIRKAGNDQQNIKSTIGC